MNDFFSFHANIEIEINDPFVTEIGGTYRYAGEENDQNHTHDSPAVICPLESSYYEEDTDWYCDLYENSSEDEKQVNSSEDEVHEST